MTEREVQRKEREIGADIMQKRGRERERKRSEEGRATS